LLQHRQRLDAIDDRIMDLIAERQESASLGDE